MANILSKGTAMRAYSHMSWEVDVINGSEDTLFTDESIKVTDATIIELSNMDHTKLVTCAGPVLETPCIVLIVKHVTNPLTTEFHLYDRATLPAKPPPADGKKVVRGMELPPRICIHNIGETYIWINTTEVENYILWPDEAIWTSTEADIQIVNRLGVYIEANNHIVDQTDDTIIKGEDIFVTA